MVLPMLKIDPQQLALRARQGHRPSLALLHQQLHPYILRQARGLSHRASIEDLTQEGHLALTTSVKTYDPGRGVPFLAYVYTSIRRHVLEASHQMQSHQGVPLRIPRSARRQMAALSEGNTEGMSAARVRELEGLRRLSRAESETAEQHPATMSLSLEDQVLLREQILDAARRKSR